MFPPCQTLTEKIPNLPGCDVIPFEEMLKSFLQKVKKIRSGLTQIHSMENFIPNVYSLAIESEAF